MSCSCAFTQEFVEEVLGSTFLRKEYRKLREDALLEMQLALVPGTMAFVDTMRERKALEANLATMLQRKQQLLEEVSQLSHDIVQQREDIEAVTAAILTTESSGGAASGLQRSRKCLNTDCLGAMLFTQDVDTQMCCSACQRRACIACHELLSLDPRSGEHACDPDAVASVSEIASSSKPCPGCGHGIYRTEGCAVMFCTACHTAFDYHTGAIQRSNIHNPHFFEWLQENPDAGAAFEEDRFEEFMEGQQVAPGGCNLPALGQVRDAYAHDKKRCHEVMALYRLAMHMGDEVRTLAEQLQQATNSDVFYRDLRIQYIMKDITDLELKRELYMRERHNDKRVACHQLYDMFTRVLVDMLHRLIATDLPFTAVMTEATTLRNYVNKASQDIAKRFGSKTITIRPDWEVVSGARRVR